MVKGFDIFETRNNFLHEGVSIYPPIYKLFYSTFEVGQGKLRIPGVFLEQINQVAGILEQKIDSNIDFIIYDFLSLQESKVFIENTYEKGDHILENYFPIAECDSNKALLVGINSTNNDQIFIENTNLFADGKRYKFLANNIFEFISKISYIELDNIGYGISGYDQLFKEWNDANWKVKRDSS
jgi:hypothetical protein